MLVSRDLLEPYYKDKRRLEADLRTTDSGSAEDIRLFEWLCSEDEVWPALCPVFQRRLGTRKGFGAWLIKADALDYQLSDDMKRIGAFFVVLELREFGGHTLWNRAGRVTHYEDLVCGVHERVSTRFAKTMIREMLVAEREASLSAMILSESLDRLSPEKVNDLLREARLEPTGDFQELKDGLLRKVSSIGSSSLKSLLGRAAAKRLALRLIESVMERSGIAQAGRLGRLASSFMPLALRRAGLYISLGLLLKDVYGLGGEATRVTNPAVIIIALYRSLGGR
jgi:hypothetical protein